MTGHSFFARLGRDSAWIPWAFVGGFILIFAVNGVMVFAAFSSWTGLETQDAFKRGLRFNEVIDDGRRQAALGWQAAMSHGRDAEGRPLLEVRLSDADGLPLTGAKVSAEMVRPTSEGHDFEVVLTDRGGGHYAVPLVAPLPGLWEARVIAERGRDAFRMDGRVVLP